MKRLVSVLISSAFALAFGIGAGPAAADNVGCGDTIIVDTVLHEHVGPCAGDGLTVNAGVTLDLNHKRIRGSGNDVGWGITIKGTGVTVKNGSLKDFVYGIFVFPGSHGAILEATAQLSTA